MQNFSLIYTFRYLELPTVGKFQKLTTQYFKKTLSTCDAALIHLEMVVPHLGEASSGYPVDPGVICYLPVSQSVINQCPRLVHEEQFYLIGRTVENSGMPPSSWRRLGCSKFKVCLGYGVK